MGSKIVNLDAHASTRIAPEVLAAVCRVLSETHGNSSSNHRLGEEAARVIEEARAEVAGLVGSHADEIVFTPGATAAINLGIRGYLAAAPKPRGGKSGTVLTTLMEHRAVLESIEQSKREFRIEARLISPDRLGRIEPRAVREALGDDALLVSLSHANGEIGTVNDIPEIGATIREGSRAALMVDSSQSAAYLPIDAAAFGVDLMVVSSHKMHGPKGVAALFVRRGTRVAPILWGGGQERGLWPGTPNHALIAGFGVAARLARERRRERCVKVQALREAFWAKIRESGPGITLNGHRTERLPGNLSVTIAGVPAQRLRQIDGLALSSGAACSSRHREPSFALKAIGLDEALIGATLRIGLSEDLTLDEVVTAADRLASEIRQIRAAQ